MTPERPRPTAGMRHVALFVSNFEETEHFYVDLMGMQVEWRPDPDNVYLCSGTDNLALHRARTSLAAQGQKLDHIGFIIDSPEQVDAWYEFLKLHKVHLLKVQHLHNNIHKYHFQKIEKI